MYKFRHQIYQEKQKYREAKTKTIRVASET